MKIIINLTKKEMNHLKVPHTFYDECNYACSVLYKIQKEIDKKLNKKKDVIK